MNGDPIDSTNQAESFEVEVIINTNTNNAQNDDEEDEVVVEDVIEDEEDDDNSDDDEAPEDARPQWLRRPPQNYVPSMSGQSYEQGFVNLNVEEKPIPQCDTINHAIHYAGI